MVRVKKRFDVGVDRLSNLPDDLIGKIFSHVDAKQAIETSGLSSRWRYTWTSMPSLNFSSEYFPTLPKFSKFVTNVLSRRNNQVEVSSIKLIFHGNVSRVIVKRVMKYVSSHNIQKLNITCLSSKKIKIYIPAIKSQSLKSLTLTAYIEGCFFANPLTWELQALTTLDLHHVTLRYGNTETRANLFSNCANLINLTLDGCMMIGVDVFDICHPGLSCLTLARCSKDINVDAPQLKNLVVVFCRKINLISTPNLSSLSFTSICYEMKISTDVSNLEKVEMCIFFPYNIMTHSQQIVRVLQQIHSVQFLTLNLELVQTISSSVELIRNQLSPFANLKSLMICSFDLTLWAEAQTEVTISNEVKRYLLGGSSCDTFTMISYEDMYLLKKLSPRHHRVLMDRIEFSRSL